MKEYNAESITVLSDVDHIRQRSGMYIGSGDDPRQLLSEIFDNSVDEVQNGFSPDIRIDINTKDNVYSVRDYGRGIPHGLKKLESGEEKEIIEVLLTKANSGGKFNNDSYLHSSGLHGLGITITNALSNYIDLTSYRKGRFVHGHSEGGKNTIIEKGKTTEPDGTLTVFCPDKEFFTNPVIPADFIINRCSVASALLVKSDLYIDGVKVDTNKNFFDLITDDAGITTYFDSPVFEVSNKKGEEMKVGIRYTSDTKDRSFGFTNMLPNSLGGTHVNCLSNAIIESWEEFLDCHRNLKPAVDLKKNDYLVGSRQICAVFIEEPKFSSQTKEKLDMKDKHYFDELMVVFKKKFKKWLEDNILQTQQIVKRFEEYRIAQNSLLSRKEISSLIKINTDDSDNIRRRSVVSKLVECTSRSRKDTELFIVEGDSALGPYLYVRDKEKQAVLPIRGKILNTTGMSLKDVVKNKEVCDIANSVGTGIGSACDASKSRYDKVIISADADPDGLQINCLVLAMLINVLPDMVKAGRVYVSIPPLYCWGTSVKDYGWCNKVEDIPANAKNVHRFKGLGEMNDDQLKYFLVDPATRNVMKVTYPSDIAKFNKILGTSEGKYELLKNTGILV